MAKIDARGFVDDGSDDLSVLGNVTVLGTMSVAGAANGLGKLTTAGNVQAGQNLGAPNTWVPIAQWLTSSWSSVAVTTNVSSSMTINSSGLYMHAVNMSFSGSAGIYTFGMFESGTLDPDCQVQETLAAGQPFPTNVVLADIDYHTAGDIVDVRVKCTNAGANFQLNYGNFMLYKMS